MENKQNNLWYVRRGKTVKGPFPAEQIKSYALLGRIKENDEVGQDKKHWALLTNFPHLVPHELKHKDNETAQSDLMRAQIRADERYHPDRRDDEDPEAAAQFKRRGVERRSPEPDELVRARDLWINQQKKVRSRKPASYWPMVVVIIVFLLVAAQLFNREMAIDVSKPDCAAAAFANVNWSHCQKDGASLTGKNLNHATLISISLINAQLSHAQLQASDLSYANLKGANMRSADLSNARLMGANLVGASLHSANLSHSDMRYTDLSGANLQNAQLTGALLGSAIWVDGKTCKPGSIGNCIK
ncbi:MAG: pentapeptide repeat-containing protein [Gammaproteobacteria bacterium]|nr:pentapeptide repeat-containing protein [Gammaproteobacteria bacterium]